MADDPGGRMRGVVRPGDRVRFTFAGRAVEGFVGETIAAALWADQQRALRRSRVRGEPRGIFCNMGICYECLVQVDGREVRACMTTIRPGMVVEPTQ